MGHYTYQNAKMCYDYSQNKEIMGLRDPIKDNEMTIFYFAQLKGSLPFPLLKKQKCSDHAFLSSLKFVEFKRQHHDHIEVSDFGLQGTVLAKSSSSPGEILGGL